MSFSFARRGTQVRGCGCCLPIPLGMAAASGIGLRVAYGRLRS
ncbi:MAG TPA: hypothetical protein VGV10_04680 [Thermoleophilaceae bacterium]|nr:hypothetical protein [Thermoleophilaceae bacterium]